MFYAQMCMVILPIFCYTGLRESKDTQEGDTYDRVSN